MHAFKLRMHYCPSALAHNKTALVHSHPIKLHQCNFILNERRSFYRFPCMWRQKWHQLEDLLSLYHQLMDMPGLPCDGLAMNHDVHLTGHTLSCGLWQTLCLRLLLMLGVWISVLQSVRRDSLRTQGRRNEQLYIYLRFRTFPTAVSKINPAFVTGIYILRLLFWHEKIL